MPRFFLLSVLLIAAFTASSQSGWDIDYIKVDSISSKDVTRLVKIDFKSRRLSPVDKEEKRISVRYFISPQDTGQLVIEKDTLSFIERRNIHIDWGFYNEQYLECTHYSSNRSLQAYETEIMEVKEDSILFRLHLETYSKVKGKVSGKPIRWTALTWIEKKKLDGVLIQK